MIADGMLIISECRVTQRSPFSTIFSKESPPVASDRYVGKTIRKHFLPVDFSVKLDKRRVDRRGNIGDSLTGRRV